MWRNCVQSDKLPLQGRRNVGAACECDHDVESWKEPLSLHVWTLCCFRVLAVGNEEIEVSVPTLQSDRVAV